MATYVVTAMFASHAEAERASRRIAGDLCLDDVVVVAAEDGASGAPEADDMAVLLGDLSISDAHRGALQDGLRRGCAVVIAALDDGDEAERAAHLMNAAGALDLDAQRALWRERGLAA